MNMSQRNPSFLVDIITQIDKAYNIKITFYQRGDCNVLLNKFQKMYPDLVENKGSVSSTVAKEAISQADILVMIGTPGGDQIAGKTYEYLSTGKKILYISKREDDVNVEFLKAYPLFLNICENKPLDNAELMHFLFTDYQCLPFDKVQDLYHDATADYFYKRFIMN